MYMYIYINTCIYKIYAYMIYAHMLIFAYIYIYIIKHKARTQVEHKFT